MVYPGLLIAPKKIIAITQFKVVSTARVILPRAPCATSADDVLNAQFHDGVHVRWRDCVCGIRRHQAGRSSGGLSHRSRVHHYHMALCGEVLPMCS